MTLTRKLGLALILSLLLAGPSSAFALGLGFGAKLGLGNGLQNDDAGDISSPRVILWPILISWPWLLKAILDS